MQWQGRLEGGGYKAQPCRILALKRRKARIFDFQPYKAENFLRLALRLTDKCGFFPCFAVLFSRFQLFYQLV